MPSAPTGIQPSRWDSAPAGATTAPGRSRAAARGAPWSTTRSRQQRAPSRRRSRACGPLHDRLAALFGRQRAARRQGRLLSGPLRPFPTRGGTPGYPRTSEKCPSTPFLSATGPRGPPHRRPPGPAIEGHPASDCRLLFRANYRCLPPGHRSRSRQHASMNTVAPAIAAFAPLYRRPPPPFRRQRAARRQSQPLSGPLRPFPTRGGTPGYPRTSEKCPSTPFLSATGPRGPPHRRPPGPAIEGHPASDCRLLFRANYRCLPPGHRSRSRQHASMNTVAPAIAAFAPLYRRPPPPFRRQRAARRQSQPLSGPLRPFPTRGGTPGYPRTSEKCPSTPFLSAAGPRGPPAPAPPGPTNRRHRVRSPVAVPRRLPLPAAGPPVEVAAARQHEHRRARDRGIRTPPPPAATAVSPSARRSASESASQRPPEALPNPRRYSRVPPNIRKMPVNAVSQRRWPARFATPAPRTNHSTRRSASQMLLSSASRCRLHRSNHRRCSLLSQGGVPGTGNRPPWRTPAKWPLPLLTPSERSERTVRLIQKSHPAILAGAGSDHSPVAFYFRNGWLFSPEYAH